MEVKGYLKVNQRCSCGQFILAVNTHKVTKGKEAMTGTWFECPSCRTTIYWPDEQQIRRQKKGIPSVS